MERIPNRFRSILFISTLFFISSSESFSFHQIGGTLQVNKLSSPKTPLLNEYYYCKPKKIQNSAENLGEQVHVEQDVKNPDPQPDEHQHQHQHEEDGGHGPDLDPEPVDPVHLDHRRIYHAEGTLQVNKLSSPKTRLLNEYYFFDYCKPKKFQNSAENLGEQVDVEQDVKNPDPQPDEHQHEEDGGHGPDLKPVDPVHQDHRRIYHAVRLPAATQQLLERLARDSRRQERRIDRLDDLLTWLVMDRIQSYRAVGTEPHAPFPLSREYPDDDAGRQ